MSECEVSQELLNIYLEDARGHLDALDHCLLALEREGFDPDLVSTVLGPLHTLKGNSGMMGFSSIKDYVHKLEDVFNQVIERGAALEPWVFDGLFAGASALRDAVEQACQEKREVRDLTADRVALEELLAPEVQHTAVQPLPRVAPAREAPKGGVAPSKRSSPHVAPSSSTVRVDFSQLDHLLNLVGEL